MLSSLPFKYITVLLINYASQNLIKKRKETQKKREKEWTGRATGGESGSGSLDINTII